MDQNQITATDILLSSADVLDSRGRYMAHAVEMFNARHRSNLTEAQGWYLMSCLDHAAMESGEFNQDHYYDAVSHSALHAECMINNEAHVGRAVNTRNETIDFSALEQFSKRHERPVIAAKNNAMLFTPPETLDGEQWAGSIIMPESGKSYHAILLPGDSDKRDWNAQMEWAASIGGELPDQLEGALLQVTMKAAFNPEWYWLRKQHATCSSFAWCQGFSNGYQDRDYKTNELRARAVRRLPI